MYVSLQLLRNISRLTGPSVGEFLCHCLWYHRLFGKAFYPAAIFEDLCTKPERQHVTILRDPLPDLDYHITLPHRNHF